MTSRDVLSAATEAFTALTGATPTGVWSSPGRANLIGEHTDYNEGFVLPFAIDARTCVAAAPRTDGVLRVSTTVAQAPVQVPIAELDHLVRARPLGRDDAWAAYPLGVAWALLQAAGPQARAAVTGADLAFASDVPVGAGLSSSAAIEGAAALALRDLWGWQTELMDLATAGQRAENEAVGAPTGIMDQVASLLGEADAATFLDCRTLQTRSIPLHLADEGLTVLVMDSQVEHSHATGGYKERRAACERVAAELGVPALRDATVKDLQAGADHLEAEDLRRARHVITENARVLQTIEVLAADGPRAIGALLLASHASMRDDFENSVPEIDTAVEAAVEAGAIGARMTGGGFGGSSIALVEQGKVEEVQQAVDAALAERGLTPARMMTVLPSEGVRRDR